ncbi:hypothetical protein [Ramlibacter sp. PS4R-6]|uniref:hypothetical protein n=1 Tax=Ramlibacter sp. PS4R-6 TaxID=3133438 RepID=UPI0030A15824
MWLAFSGTLLWAFLEHGRMLGGIQYFSHMGRGGAAAAQVVLIVGSLALSGLVWVRSSMVKPVGITVALVGLAFALSFVLPLPGIAILNPYVFPLGTAGMVLPFVVAVAAFATSSMTFDAEA